MATSLAKICDGSMLIVGPDMLRKKYCTAFVHRMSIPRLWLADLRQL